MGDQVKLVIYGHSMGTGVGSRAVVECTRDKTARVDGVILDSPMHSVMYALKQNPNFLHYSSFIFDWQKFVEVAGIEFNVAKVGDIDYFNSIIQENIILLSLLTNKNRSIFIFVLVGWYD